MKRKYVLSGTMKKLKVTERTGARNMYGNICQSKTKQKFANLNYPSAHVLWTNGFTVYGDMTKWREHVKEDINPDGESVHTCEKHIHKHT